MASYSMQRDRNGTPGMVVTMQWVDNPLVVLRAIKQAFPEEFQQVAMEIDVPKPGQVNRILDVNGKANGHDS